MNRRWTKDEIVILENNSKLSDISIMKLLPNRSLKAIGIQKHRLGLSRNRPNWNQDEIEILKEKYVSSKKEDILIYLPNRCWNSIVAKAMNFNLKRNIPVKDRFLEKIEIDKKTKCWNWIGRIDKSGYGQFCVDHKTYGAHVISYELFVGEIPVDLQLDHLCRNRKCVNYEHLEPVTPKENLRRSPIHNINKTHCPKGHEYRGENLFYYKNERRCRICSREQNKKYRNK